MRKKNIIRVQKPLSNDMICMTHSSSCYVDQDFFNTKMHENLDDETYGFHPVRIECQNIQWIINDNIHGLKFLRAVYETQDIEMFDINTLKVIIEFLFKEFKNTICLINLPLYLM